VSVLFSRRFVWNYSIFIPRNTATSGSCYFVIPFRWVGKGRRGDGVDVDDELRNQDRSNRSGEIQSV
jgi:hypothetical protein